MLVLNNRDLSFVSWETRATLGARPDPESSSLPDVPYAEWARLLGLDGARIEHPDQIDDVFDRALPPTGRSSSTRWSTRPSR